MIDKMFSDHNKTKPVIVDLIRRTNVKFLIPGSEVSISKNKRSNSTPKPKKKDEPGTISDVYYHPMFASGNVITPIMLESILSSAYEMPALINIFNAFVGIRYPADVEIDKTLSLEQSRLCHVHVPRELAGRPFGDIYKVFSEVQGVVPLGILRTDTRDDNVLPYVITNPLWSWLVNEDDMIYVLAPPSILQ
jgi:hypothetical protein